MGTELHTIIDSLALHGDLVLHATNPSVDDYRNALERLGQGDFEAAHGIADALAEKVLCAIRDGHPNPQQLAADALNVMSAEFPSHCA